MFRLSKIWTVLDQCIHNMTCTNMKSKKRIWVLQECVNNAFLVVIDDLFWNCSDSHENIDVKLIVLAKKKRNAYAIRLSNVCYVDVVRNLLVIAFLTPSNSNNIRIKRMTWGNFSWFTFLYTKLCKLLSDYLMTKCISVMECERKNGIITEITAASPGRELRLYAATSQFLKERGKRVRIINKVNNLSCRHGHSGRLKTLCVSLHLSFEHVSSDKQAKRQ